MSAKDRAIVLLKKALENRKRVIIAGSGLILLMVILWIALHLNWTLIFHGQPEEVPVVTKSIEYDQFEFPVDSFSTEDIEIRPNQFLSNILVEKGISMGTVDRIAKEFKNIFDVRNLKAGNELHFYYTTDTLRKLQYMVYKKNASEYVVYDLRDSLQVSLRRKEIKTEVAYMERTITSSIWNAVAETGVSIGMVAEISSVFQWMIDPTSLNKGDRLEVIFENQTVDNVSIGVGRVLAARFLYGKRWFEAYIFEQNGVESYFNEKGESLRRAFLKWPFNAKQSFRISSKFTGSRMHPILRIRRPHYGVDYAVAAGTPVVSIGDGKVILKGWTNGGGNTLKIKHNGQFTTGYMHLKGYGPGIAAGSSVSQGQVIGYVGSTGLSSGPHLDFRMWENGKPVDPLKVESPPVEPVDPKLRPQFDSIVKVFNGEFEKYKATSKGSASIL
jgi:murein DD-endopeptidase MepM/ murein hydrolase activator NlpD